MSRELTERQIELCGCSSMVEFQPSKLVTWVRFPSPAPSKKFEKTLKKFLTRTKRYGNILNVLDENKEVNNAGVAELADARDLKSRG